MQVSIMPYGETGLLTCLDLSTLIGDGVVGIYVGLMCSAARVK